MSMKADAEGKAYDDINVTPMVDLYLVLLLIFIIMTTAGLQGLKVKLPKESAATSQAKKKIQAIRAALDGGYVRENHKLNDGLVFLTISIAGGPFMGLLGTVVGVMITFAAIAATGEVNISAIAPGLAAALVATVAGLLVAIPALLGYNYLTAQLKNVTADLQIFIDEFVTKMAEFYSPVTEQQPMHQEVSYVHES